MSAYSLTVSNVSSQSPKLAKGKIRIFASVNVYWCIGENALASPNGCALLPAGQSIELRLPVSCSRLSVLAVKESGIVTVTETHGGAKASCA
jgi:hypothetical protein